MSNSITNYTELDNSRNLNEDNSAQIDAIEEHPFNWVRIIIDISISAILAFGIFFLIAEVHEITHNPQVADITSFNNLVESIYLFFVFSLIISQLIHFRWNRNCYYELPFDNFPMLIILCLYGLVEIIYYTIRFISIFTSCHKFDYSLCSAMELIFMTCLLPLSIVTVKNNVRKEHIWLKMKTKVIIILSMIGCLLISSRKTTIKFKKDLENTTYTSDIASCTLPKYAFEIHNMCSSILDVLEITDINYFIIAFILLINPLQNLDKHDETMIEVSENSYVSRVPFSILKCISLVRFRLITGFLSLGIVSSLSVVLFMNVNIIMSSLEDSIKNVSMTIFMSLLSFGYVITIVYGIFYYFADIKNWDIDQKQDLKSDQYFNYITSSAQLVFSSAMIIGLMLFGLNGNIPINCVFIADIVNFTCLFIQILIQANCIHSASRRTLKTLPDNRDHTWKFKLIPPLILASFNLITMVISIAYIVYPKVSNSFDNLRKEKLLWIIMKDFTLPLTILNRFHGMTFFINLTVKQWM